MLNSESIDNKIDEVNKDNNPQAHLAWSGMLPVGDTALAVTDTGGTGIPFIYLNGQFAT